MYAYRAKYTMYVQGAAKITWTSDQTCKTLCKANSSAGMISQLITLLKKICQHFLAATVTTTDFLNDNYMLLLYLKKANHKFLDSKEEFSNVLFCPNVAKCSLPCVVWCLDEGHKPKCIGLTIKLVFILIRCCSFDILTLFTFFLHLGSRCQKVRHCFVQPTVQNHCEKKLEPENADSFFCRMTHFSSKIETLSTGFSYSNVTN